MKRHVWDGWKVRLTSGLVAMLLGGLLALLLSGQLALPPRAGPTATLTPGSTALARPPRLVVPAGWQQVLPGLILSDFSHFNTLIVSPARPGRVAACALPPHPWPEMMAPVFVLTNDGGRTWQQQAIPAVGVIWACDLHSDPLDPDTYTLRVTRIFQGRAAALDETIVTHDGGRTWHLGSPPSSMDPACVPWPQNVWMPGGGEVDACAFDPRGPTHLYVIAATSTSPVWSGLSLYETRDSQGTWRLLHTWGTARRMMEIHVTSSALYVVDNQDTGDGEGVYRSPDGGVSWAKLPLTSPLSTVSYFGPTGRLLTTEYSRLFQIDPLTGKGTLLGEVPVIQGDGYGVISAVAICEGEQPSLVISGPHGTYVRMLPSLGS